MSKPLTTLDLVNGVKSLTEKGTAYAVAKRLGVNPETALKWVHGKGTMSDETALKAAKELGLNPEYVLICMHLEREKNEDVKRYWKHIMSVIPYAACYGFIGFAGLVYFMR